MNGRMIDNETINNIKNSVDIVDIISERIPLTSRGRNLFGVCPFHDDHSPSMSVSKDKQIYKCFSCGASGNVITFVMDYEHVDFKEALSILAKRAGIEFSKGAVKGNSNRYDKYYKMYDLALKLYQNNINTSKGESAISYLENRKIDKDLIKEFKIGLSLDDNGLSNILSKKNYSAEELDIYGLGTGTGDLYLNRIMFPLFDTNDRPVGFSGRTYKGNSSNSKYINTKETPLFKKGELLYNYYKAKEMIRLEKKLVIVEGFMDVIRLHSIGIKNVIALMGTALTKQQISLIKRLSNNVYLCLDGDKAGRSAMQSIGKELTDNGVKVSVIPLRDNLDPDEYVLKYGKESFVNLYKNPINYSEFRINYMKEGVDFSNLEEKSSYINSILEEVSKETDEIKQEFMLKKLSEEFDIDISILKNNLKKSEKYSKIDALSEKPQKKEKLDKYDKATYEILCYMLENYEAAKYYEKKLNFLPTKEARYLANEIIYAYRKNGDLVLADFITSLTDKEDLLSLLREVLKNTNSSLLNKEAFEDCVNVIRNYNEKERIKSLKKQMSEEMDPIKKAQLLEEIRLVKMGSGN